MTRTRVLQFLGSGLFLLVAAFLFNRFLAQHEVWVVNEGWSFNDLAFNWLPIYDLSPFIFIITYGSMILYAILQFKESYFVEKLMLAYGLMIFIRMITITLVPLQPPVDLVALQDPFLNNLVYPGEINGDLFFSGHTGLLLTLFFLSRKWIFIILALIMGAFLMIQRVHFSIDILAALPFSYAIVRSVEFFCSRWDRAE